MKALRTQLITRWQALNPREQRGLAVLGVLLALWLFWTIAIAPALNTLRDSDNRRTQIGQQHARMLALQNQAQDLKARTPLSHDEALRNLQDITPAPQIQLNAQAERVSVQLKAVPANTLANWLAQARNQAQTLPIEVHLTRSSTSDANATVVWDGNLVMRLPSRTSTAN